MQLNAYYASTAITRHVDDEASIFTPKWESTTGHVTHDLHTRHNLACVVGSDWPARAKDTDRAKSQTETKVHTKSAMGKHRVKEEVLSIRVKKLDLISCPKASDCLTLWPLCTYVDRGARHGYSAKRVVSIKVG